MTSKWKKNIRIQRFSTWSICAAVGLAVLFSVLAIFGFRDFQEMKRSMEQYILCEQAAHKLQEGSDLLTAQVRLYAMTGQRKYMDAYVEEVEVTQAREKALDVLNTYFAGTEAMTRLEDAMAQSQDLMGREYYAMHLVAAATGCAEGSLPEEVTAAKLHDVDFARTSSEQLQEARRLVSDDTYEETKARISANVDACLQDILTLTRNRQNRTSSIFLDLYISQEVGLALLTVLLLSTCEVVRRQIVKPLMAYNARILQNDTCPEIGAAELLSLSRNYNKVFEENRKTQQLFRHKAEHDSMTDLLNRESFERILHIYSEGATHFALILADVDHFKSINDTYGHATGDEAIKLVARHLADAFRSNDYVCRIGGDEFAVIMVDVDESMRGLLAGRLAQLKQGLAKRKDDRLPPVTLSVGAAFSDRPKPQGSLFEDADRALYQVKENGRNGYAIY